MIFFFFLIARTQSLPLCFYTSLNSPSLNFWAYLVNSSRPLCPLTFLSFYFFVSQRPFFSRLLLSASPAHFSPTHLYFILTLIFLAFILLCLIKTFCVSFTYFLAAIRPRQRAGTIQRWQSCTRRWVSEETMHSFAHLFTTPVELQKHCLFGLVLLGLRGSLRDLHLSHLGDYNFIVINLRDPIYQCCDCFPLSR